jgi:hypothetical protein
MSRTQNPNLLILETAVTRLGSLADDLVFLGGCATGLLLTDAAAPPIRVTRDVDAIAELGSLVDYHRLSEKLRDRGFREDSGDHAPICRWVSEEIILDVMPTDTDVLGFGNEWYGPALKAATSVKLPSGKPIRMVTAPYFLATKLAAFDGRGKGDYVLSHDIEDIVSVVDGRPEIVDEVRCADQSIQTHLAERFAALINDTKFMAALPGHLPADASSQERVPLVVERMKAMFEMD